MVAILIRITTVILQIVAGILALQLIRMTKRKRVWVFISAAIFLTAIQRSITYYQLLYGVEITQIQLSTEYIAFYIAILTLLGIAGLHPLFRSLNKSHKEVKKSEAKYRTLLENLPQCICLKNANLVYSSYNENFARDVNMDSSQIAGKTDYDLYAEDIARKIQSDDRRVIERGKITEDEDEYNKNGEKIYIHTVKTPLRNSEGEVYGLLVLYWDITAQKKEQDEHEKLKEKMQQAQKLEGLGVLAGGIAHDFNNLLTGILGNTYLAQKELPENSTIHANLKEIESASDRAAEITSQMLAYSGQGQYIVKELNLGDEIENLENLIKASISKKIALKLDIDNDNPPLVEADPFQIRQVIVNLITNGSEAIGDNNGDVSVAVGKKHYNKRELSRTVVNIDELESGDYAYLQVRDTGCGFDESEAGKLFEPFHTTKFTGRGLGLAAVLGIVRSRKGGIIVSSEKGIGSTFTVLLPLAGAADKPLNREHLPPLSATTPANNGGTVLLVDDERVVRTVAERLISIAGFKVLTATNGREAIDVYKSNKDDIDCILLDMTMPIMNGSEVLMELKKLDGNVKVILSSGYDESDVTSQFTHDDLAGFVKKPYNYDKLYAAIREAISDHNIS